MEILQKNSLNSARGFSAPCILKLIIMFNKDFYPTPNKLIQKMLEPYLKKSRFGEKYDIEGDVLEPSAGKGDILNFLVENADFKPHRRLYAIESEAPLQTILREEGYQVVDSDFLSHKSDIYYDYIFMNPPFSNGEEHLLKAIEVSEDTEIVCILNAETIRNPFSQKRKELEASLNYFHAKIEFIQDAFKSAERTTGVEIALIRLHVVKENKRFSFDFSDSEEQKVEIDESYITNDIMREDAIGNMIHIYEKSKDAYVELMKAQDKFYSLHNYITRHGNHQDEFTTGEGDHSYRFNFFCQGMKGIMWKYVIKKLNMQKYMSHQVLSNFDKFIKQQSKMAFTKDNTREFFEMIMMNRGNIMDQAIVEVFDLLTKHYDDNRSGVEGWKTNDAYKINKRVILNDGCKMSWYGNDAKNWGTEFQTNFHAEAKYADLDKVMCYIDGKDHDKIVTVNEAMEIRFKEIGKIFPGDKFDNVCESTFFNIKFYKKGTVHIQFKDEKIWEQFNLRAAKGKNWLPESKYSDIKDDKQQNTDTHNPRVGENGQLSIC